MITENEMLLRLLIAVAVGGAIGFEREMKNQPAGLRTHIAVILGAALVMIVSKYGFADVDIVNKDPARLAAQVVSGIGFLGAGTIIVHRNMIRGLTTAASLWTTAGIGLAIGAGMYVVGVGTGILLLIVLIFVQKLELKAVKKKYKKLSVYTVEPQKFIQELEQILRGNDIRLHEIRTDPVQEEQGNQGMTEEGLMKIEVYLHLPVYSNGSFLLTEFSKVPGVRRVDA